MTQQPKLTQRQKYNAVEQMIVHLQNEHELYKQKTIEYRSHSVRGLLRELGFFGEDCDAVIGALALAGFTNCLDPEIALGTNIEGVDPTKAPEFPDYEVCVWGYDQLLSRLESYIYRIPKS
jgi:hypothetical protein